MNYLFAPALVAVVVISMLWLSTLSFKKQKPMLQQIEEARIAAANERWEATKEAEIVQA